MKVAEVWHYEKRDKHDGIDPNSGLFTQYINKFLKMKIEASGWPKYVKTDEQKQDFILRCKLREGIDLDPSKNVKNPGLRSLAKLCLNR